MSMATINASARVPVHGGMIRTAVVVERCEGQELEIIGSIEVRTVAAVRTAVHEVIDRGVGDLVLHLGAAEIGDATGLGVLVGAHRRAERRGRRLVLADASPRLERLLRGSRLHRVIARSGDIATA